MVVAVTGALVALWSRLPERWVVHWGPDGQPDGTAERTLGGVFGPVLVAFVLLAVFGTVLVGIRGTFAKRAETAADRDAMLGLGGAAIEMLRCIELGILVVPCFFALYLPLARPDHPGLGLGVALPFPIIGIVLGVARYARAQARLPSSGTRAGLFVRDPSDPRLFVPKPGGVGQTLNMAHRAAWFALLVVLAIPLTAAVLLVSFALGGGRP